jgi:sugar lactone lactonase YvrE
MGAFKTCGILPQRHKDTKTRRFGRMSRCAPFVRVMGVGLCAWLFSACATPSTALPTQVITIAAPTSTAMVDAPTTEPMPATAMVPVPALSMRLEFANDLAFDSDGNLYVSTCGGLAQVYKIDVFGLATVYASPVQGGVSGDGGLAIDARISCAKGMALDRDGNLYVADSGNNRVRRIDRNGIIETVAGSGSAPGFAGDGGPATKALLFGPTDGAIDAEGNLYIIDAGNHRIRKVDQAGIISTFAGTGTAGFSGDGGPAVDAQLRLEANKGEDFGQITFDDDGNLYFTDTGNGRVRKIDPEGVITTVAGNGALELSGDGGRAIDAALINPTGLAFDAEGNLYVANVLNGVISDNRIRKIDPSGIITTYAGGGDPDLLGDGGPATEARLNLMQGIAVDDQGNLYIIAGDFVSRIRKVDLNGIITTVAGGS